MLYDIRQINTEKNIRELKRKKNNKRDEMTKRSKYEEEMWRVVKPVWQAEYTVESARCERKKLAWLRCVKRRVNQIWAWCDGAVMIVVFQTG